MIEAIRGDLLTKSRLARKDVETLESNRGGVEFRTAQNPLDHYLKRRLITVHEYRAAERLFRDFTVSAQTPGMIINLDMVSGGSKGFTQAQMDARSCWREAINSIYGKIGQLMVLNVCCYGYWLKDVKYLPYREKQAFPRFREALDNLIQHYKNTN